MRKQKRKIPRNDVGSGCESNHFFHYGNLDVVRLNYFLLIVDTHSKLWYYKSVTRVAKIKMTNI